MGKKKGTDYETVLICQKSHAGYYPGAVTLFLKLIFGRKGEIYGAQIAGQEGADKRIDTIASVMGGMKGTIYDLEEWSWLCTAVFLGQGPGEYAGIYCGKCVKSSLSPL